MFKIRLLCVFIATITLCWSQTEPTQGLRNKTPQIIAITNANVFINPSQKIENATIVIRNGFIESVGQNITIPPEAQIWDVHSSTVYPGFIETFSDYGLPQNSGNNANNSWLPSTNKKGTPAGGRHWNDAVHAEKRAAKAFSANNNKAKELRSQGFTIAQTSSLDGIFRGQSAVVSLGSDPTNNAVLKHNHAQFASFRKGSSKSSYPGSLMGSIALIRQVLMDSSWYQKAYTAYARDTSQKKPELNYSLEALQNVLSGQQSIVFSTSNELSLLRAAKIAQEFGLTFIYKGSGYEYRRLEAIAKLQSILIVPVNFPHVPDITTPERQFDVSLGKLKHWNAAKENPALLERAEIAFAFTTNGLKNSTQFLTNVREAVARGLSTQKALEALTTVPARICGISQIAGTIERGKQANFVISDDDIFAKKSQIYSVWVRGEKFVLKERQKFNFNGKWQVSDNKHTFEIHIENNSKATIHNLEGAHIEDFATNNNQLHFQVVATQGVSRFSGRMWQEKLSGIVLSPQNERSTWQAQRKLNDETKQQKQDEQENTQQQADKMLFEIVYPNKAFGRKTIPQQAYTVFVSNATIWTCAQQGKIEIADMIVREGKIIQIGKDLSPPPEAIVIEGEGIHITPGLIDEHSHIAITRGVNEATQAVTAEVRIGDVVNSDDINIYRQLAGGVTSSQLLHGSANPIGGQAQVIKLRWGNLPEEMKYQDIHKGIKFALGENVKQSNWGDNYTTRYPQTRMGVREIFYDVFQTAREYEKEWQNYRQLSETEKRKVIPPRRDLELEAINDILHKKMFIHCHSYVQSEILSLARLANKFGFSVGTFTHVLEGYKVARELKETGAMASCFSDWWAYKFEVYDAIPYNAAVMHRQGVVVSINSDDAEMARRLNQEAAKAIKYGGLSEEDALKLVTINAAKQLYIDKKVGSLETGKDADFVVWNHHPLSCYSRVLQTWIDGRKYFDVEEDRKMRSEIRRQKAALIQLALNKKAKGEKVEETSAVKKKRHYHCDDIEDAVRGRD
ncbi:amidohydrolase family protein [Candidatus Uabimicrobium amorphum]|uniref:Periplasmic amidohydrolase n=1 Tax=Uabimicrobium amorphum TaxID=2596890 RepID=A0A5S9ILG6_UABAM|nr:amidohydrolase family protein [Candidatus Uabimicrobium amorphum]BBM83626.1 periplasmic amidohydrolase [Candidatus Uabimicrobium amorphum]